ncbi:MAG: tetratricopeptide repeat protein [Acidobacteria bacterium]|nr:MAG: tetratricopeptide repeat protein [Acidobacteriota bacterium]
MVNCWERLAPFRAIIFAFLVLSQAPLLRAQDKQTDIVQEIGWEISTGNIGSALADARRAVQEFPESAVLMHLLAVAQSKNGLEDEARESFQKSIRLDPTIPQNYYDLALLDMQRDDYTEAARMLENFLGVSPRNAKARLMLGIAYREQGDDAQAIAQLRQALTISPGLPLVHYNLGKIDASQGDNKSALSEYREELGVNPEFYDVYWSAGDAELAEGKLDSAEVLYRRGTEIKPLAYQAYNGLARVYLARKQWSSAEAELKTVVALAPGDIDAHATLASVYNQLGKTLEAKREELVVETLKSQTSQPEESPALPH